jgi:hypothetical protein
MALKVGDLYVSLTANTQKLQAQLNGAAKKIEAFGRSLKGLGKDAGDMANMVVAAMGAAVAAASSKDAAVKKHVDDLKNASLALAVEIGRIALPILQSMADFVARVVAVFRQMTPEQRAMATNFLQGAAAVSAVAMAAVKLEPAFKLAAAAVRLLGASFGGLTVGLLPALVAVAALIGLAGLMRSAWEDNLGGIQEKAAEVWGWLTTNGPKTGNVLVDAVKGISSAYRKAFEWILKGWATVMRAQIDVATKVAKFFKLDNVFDVDGAAEFAKTAVAWVEQLPTDSGIESLKQDALDQLGQMNRGVKLLGGDFQKQLEKIFGGLPGAAKIGQMKDLTDKAEKVQADFGRLRADKLDASFVALRGRGGNLRDSLEMAGALNVPKELEQFNGEALSSLKGIEDVRDFLHKLGAKSGETEKYLAAWERWNEEQKKNAAHVDRLREDRVPQAAEQFLGGGTLGQAARLAGITTGIPPEFEQFSGGMLRTASDFEDLRDRLAQVREKNPLIDQFIDKLQAVQEAAGKQAKELEEARKQAVSGFQDQIISSLGKVGGIVQAATGPLAQALGPIGAVVAVAFELLQGSEGFKRLMAAVDGIIQGLADALGQLLDPVSMVVNAIRPIVSSLNGLVGAVLPVLNAVLEPLLPVFVFLGALLKSLTPVIEFVAFVLNVALAPVMWILSAALKGLAAVFQVVAVVVLNIVIAVGDVWNGIISAVQGILGFLGNIEIAGLKPFAFLNDWSAGLEGAKAATDTYRAQLAEVSSMTWDSSMETAKSFNNAGAAADTLAAGMTNAASGFKVDLARFNATNVGAGPGSPADLGVGSNALVGDTYVTIVSNDPERIWEDMENVRRRKNFQRGRGPLGGLPAFGS